MNSIVPLMSSRTMKTKGWSALEFLIIGGPRVRYPIAPVTAAASVSFSFYFDVGFVHCFANKDRLWSNACKKIGDERTHRAKSRKNNSIAGT